MASPRSRKIADRIQVVVAEMLERRIKDPRLGFVTLTDVRVSGDNQQAMIFYTVLDAGEGQATAMAGTAAALESAKGLLRSEVAKQLGMRHAPTLEFVPDALPENARVLDDALARARTLDEEVAARRGTTYAGEADPYKKPRDLAGDPTDVDDPDEPAYDPTHEPDADPDGYPLRDPAEPDPVDLGDPGEVREPRES